MILSSDALNSGVGRLRVGVGGELAASLWLSGFANEKAPAAGPELFVGRIRLVAGARNSLEFLLVG